MAMPSELMARDAKGRVIGAKHLSPMQAEFVNQVVNYGKGQNDAARAAGFAHPAVSGCQLMRNPRVLAAIRAEQTRILGGELTSKSLAFLRYVLDLENDDSPKLLKLKLDASKTVLDRAGYIAPKAPEAPSDTPKDLEDYSIAELEELVRRGRDTLDGMASITPTALIEHAPQEVDAPADAPGDEEGGGDAAQQGVRGRHSTADPTDRARARHPHPRRGRGRAGPS